MSNIVLVEEKDRLGFLPGLMGAYHIQFQNLIYQMADLLIEGYDGGYWEFFRIPDGLIIAPRITKDEGMLKLSSPNGYSESLGWMEAGMVVTMYALSQFSFYLYEKNEERYDIGKMYYALREIIGESPKAKEMFRLLD